MSRSSEFTRWLILGVAVILFAASLRLPAFLFEHHSPVSGDKVLMWGWWGVITFDFGWFANPVFFFSLIAIAFKRYRTALVGSGIALALGGSSVSAEKWYFDESRGASIAGLGTAFYVWMSSFSVVFLGSLLLSVLGIMSRSKR